MSGKIGQPTRLFRLPEQTWVKKNIGIRRMGRVELKHPVLDSILENKKRREKQKQNGK